MKANSTLVGFKEKALRPLIREKDPEIQQKVISSVENAGRQKLDYNDFVESNTTLVGFKENTLHPLINEQDPEIQQKVITQIENVYTNFSTSFKYLKMYILSMRKNNP